MAADVHHGVSGGGTSRIVVLSTTEIGWECCAALLGDGHRIAGIFTMARDFEISWSESTVRNVNFRSFADLARRHRVPLVEVERRIADAPNLERLRDLTPDVLLVVGWYHLIPAAVRKLAARGAVGIHASLLPRYRGGAPLVWAMINGEREAGVSLFHLSAGVDDGDIVGQESFPIETSDDIASVSAKARAAAVGLVRRFVPLVAGGTAPRTPQDRRAATRVPQREPSDGLIGWSELTATRAHDWIRAQTRPYPGAFTLLGAERVTIWRSAPTSRLGSRSPGSITVADGLAVTCADGRLLGIVEVGLEDGTSLSGAELAAARRLNSGDRFEKSAHAVGRGLRP